VARRFMGVDPDAGVDRRSGEVAQEGTPLRHGYGARGHARVFGCRKAWLRARPGTMHG